jgi:hypothetical protein
VEQQLHLPERGVGWGSSAARTAGRPAVEAKHENPSLHDGKIEVGNHGELG